MWASWSPGAIYTKPFCGDIVASYDPDLLSKGDERVERHRYVSDLRLELPRDFLVVDDEFAEDHGKRLAIRGGEHILLLHDTFPDEFGKLLQPILGLERHAHEAHLYVGVPVFGLLPPLAARNVAELCVAIFGASSRDFVNSFAGLYGPMLESPERCTM